jgi:hypothetical protein
MITCIETIICLKYVLCKDITLQVIKIFFGIIPYWNDFIWHKKMNHNYNE